MKYFITILLTALIVGFSVVAYFKGWFPSLKFDKPQAVSTQNLEVSYVSEKKDESMTSSSSSDLAASDSASLDDSDKESILEAVKLALVEKNGPSFLQMDYKISKLEGDYASGMVNGDGGGGMWFAARVNNKWKVVADGNGVTLCSQLEPYPDFPKSMIPECWDDINAKLIKR